MNKHMSALEYTAYHEAGHVLALRSIGRRVLKVAILSDTAGYAAPDIMPGSEDEMALVGLAGIQAETEHPDVGPSLSSAIDAYVAAASDRNVIAKAFKTVWLGKAPLWYQGRYNKATKFVQEHQSEIRTIALALLAKPSFPKELNEGEISTLLK